MADLGWWMYNLSSQPTWVALKPVTRPSQKGKEIKANLERKRWRSPCRWEVVSGVIRRHVSRTFPTIWPFEQQTSIKRTSRSDTCPDSASDQMQSLGRAVATILDGGLRGAKMIGKGEGRGSGATMMEVC